MNTKTEKGYLNHILVEDGKKPMIMREMPEFPILNDKYRLGQWYKETGGFKEPLEWYDHKIAQAKSEAVEIVDDKVVWGALIYEREKSSGPRPTLKTDFKPGIYPIVTPGKFEIEAIDILETKFVAYYREPLEQHPEDTCQKCGGPNILWYAENELFNKVNGSPNGIICPKCFIKMATESGENIIFKAVPINPKILVQ